MPISGEEINKIDFSKEGIKTKVLIQRNYSAERKRIRKIVKRNKI
jgi:hypothetical protein